MIRFVTLSLLCCLCLPNSAEGQNVSIDHKHLTFLATFDSGLDADFGRGKTSARIARDVSRQKGFLDSTKIDGISIDPSGKFGSALSFDQKTKEVFCFPGEDNFPYSDKAFDATVSFWIKCDLEKLPKGFIDPLQVTDKKWNDSSIFVDFNDKRPADFRLGVFSKLSFWNPEGKDINQMKPDERPMVDAGKYPFAGDRWTHVTLVFEKLNSNKEPAVCSLYLDGKRIGTLKRTQQLEWEPKKVFIMLGIYFVGQLDDFAIFDIALTSKQIESLARSKKSLNRLLSK